MTSYTDEFADAFGFHTFDPAAPAPPMPVVSDAEARYEALIADEANWRAQADGEARANRAGLEEFTDEWYTAVSDFIEKIMRPRP